MAASKPTSRQHRSPPAGHSEAPPYRARLAAAIAAVTSIGRWMPHTQARRASVLAPVFPGCHVFCRPATYHGIEPPPVLPSLDKRAGIEPALSLLVAGGDPGFWHGPWPYLPGCAGEDHCRRQVPLYVLSHHHCAFTNKKKSDPRRMFVGPTGIRSCYPRASTVLHARALSCWPPRKDLNPLLAA